MERREGGSEEGVGLEWNNGKEGGRGGIRVESWKEGRRMRVDSWIEGKGGGRRGESGVMERREGVRVES